MPRSSVPVPPLAERHFRVKTHPIGSLPIILRPRVVGPGEWASASLASQTMRHPRPPLMNRLVLRYLCAFAGCFSE
jgi:hypothetical protein